MAYNYSPCAAALYIIIERSHPSLATTLPQRRSFGRLLLLLVVLPRQSRQGAKHKKHSRSKSGKSLNSLSYNGHSESKASKDEPLRRILRKATSVYAGRTRLPMHTLKEQSVEKEGHNDEGLALHRHTLHG